MMLDESLDSDSLCREPPCTSEGRRGVQGGERQNIVCVEKKMGRY